MPDGREVQVSAGLCGSCFYLNVLLRRAKPSKSAPLYRLALHGKTSGVQGGREVQYLTAPRDADKKNEPHKPAETCTSLPPGTSREPPGALLELLWGLSGGPLGVLWGPLGRGGLQRRMGEVYKPKTSLIREVAS